MRIQMKTTMMIPRPGGGTETYAAGGNYDVSEETAKLLGEASTQPDEPPAEPVENFEMNPPPPVLDVTDDYENGDL